MEVSRWENHLFRLGPFSIAMLNNQRVSHFIHTHICHGALGKVDLPLKLSPRPASPPINLTHPVYIHSNFNFKQHIYHCNDRYHYMCYDVCIDIQYMIAIH